MKNSLVKNSLVAILIVIFIGLTVVGCGFEDTDHTHQYTEEVLKAPTCTTQGVMNYVCSCGDSYTDTIEMVPHTVKIDAAVAPDCDNTGLTEGKHCSVCNTVIVPQETIEATGHADENKDHVCDNGCDVFQGTHAEQATSHTCQYCGEVAGECKNADNDHNCDVCGTKLSDCVAAENSHNCSVCGEKLSDCKAGAPVIENSTAATCGEPGSYDEVFYCEVCHDKLDSKHYTVDALPHDYKVTSETQATCEEAGSKTLVCGVCGDTKTEEIAPLGHNLITYEAKAPTCTEIGWDAYVTCSRCDYTTRKELPVTSHTYEETITAPTCLEGGYTTFTCSGCGKTYKGNVTEATGHKETAVVTLPDCLNGGYTTYTCTSCGATRKGDETAALGHKEEVVAGKAATCLEAGLSDGKKCSVCGIVLVEQEVISALGHDYDVTVVDATCLEAGLKTFDCKNCDHSYTEVIEPSGSHSYDNDSDYVCNDCGFDNTAYRLVNGGFENGLEGWTVVGNIGAVSSDTHYWVNDPESAEGFNFGIDGSNMFSAYAPGAFESAVGTLTSSTFKVGGTGFVTFKVGAMKDGNYVYVDVVDAETKQILARYYNGLWAERTDDAKSGCTLIAYKADLSAFAGKEVFFRISDNADSGYGLFFADSFVTYYESVPEGFNDATPVSYEVSGTIYDVFNGGFEMGNVQGWWNHGEIGVVTNATGYWGDNISYDKVGEYLFTGVESFGADTMREGNRGALTSSVFEIGGTGWISFKLGGGGSELCYVQVIDAVSGEILARYHQQAQQDAKLIQYAADLSAYIGRTVRIQVVDQADSGWGCVSFDNVVTYHTSKPEGIEAIDIKGNLKYTIDNGSFETGNLDGWSMNITEAGTHNTLGWVESSEHDAGWYAKNDDTKDGTFLFTFVKPDGTNCENSKGVLQSSTFSLKQGAFVSFKFGGAGGGSNHDVYVELCRKDGSVIARFYNDAPGKINTRMNAYFYQYTGVEVDCFFRVVDNSTGDYGCFVVDDFRVNLEAAPEGYIAAIQ